jgi:hypothetical protein
LSFPAGSEPNRSRTGHARCGGDGSNTTRSYVFDITLNLLNVLTHYVRPRVATHARSTTAAPSHPRLRLALRLSPPRPTGSRTTRGTTTDGSHVHGCSVDGLGPRLYPCGIATTVLHRRSPSWPLNPGGSDPVRSSPPVMKDGYAPRTSPYPPGLSWRRFKRRNIGTDFSRRPSRLAHQARSLRQCKAVLTLSRLLPPSPPTRGSGCLQLHPTATAARP